MDKLTPALQATPLTTRAAEQVGGWFKYESTSGIYTPGEVAWLVAQGWRPWATVTVGGRTTYFLQRQVIRPDAVLRDLVESYTEAYNEGRQLNDQRYDDLVVLYTQILDKTEDEFNTLETDDTTYSNLIGTLITALGTDFDTYEADVDGDLDDWGTALLEEINARFDAELSKGRQGLIGRGLDSTTMWTTMSAGIERERTRALNDANDRIEQRQLELKHKVYSERVSMRSRVHDARGRLRDFLRNAKDRQVELRNAAVTALAALVERRTDSYPDLAQIGELASRLGAGSPGSFSP